MVAIAMPGLGITLSIAHRRRTASSSPPVGTPGSINGSVVLPQATSTAALAIVFSIYGTANLLGLEPSSDLAVKTTLLGSEMLPVFNTGGNLLIQTAGSMLGTVTLPEVNASGNFAIPSSFSGNNALPELQLIGNLGAASSFAGIATLPPIVPAGNLTVASATSILPVIAFGVY